MRLSCILFVAILLGCSGAGQAIAADRLPDYAREYIAGSFFNGTDPADPAIADAVEILSIPAEMATEIRALDWEAGQLQRFARPKLYLLVDCPDGTVHALMFRDGRKRNDRTLDASRARVLRRLYSAELWAFPPDPPLATWLAAAAPDPAEVWQQTLQASANEPWDRDTLERAAANYNADGTRRAELALALAALADSDYWHETARAALWLISRMDAMSFRRENGTDSIPDLQAVEARTFYENVHYAVRARAEFPWAADVSEQDFLQQVLSPRGSGEPLQRWRRHFYMAMLPELEDLTMEDAAQAISVARNAYADFYQYEGDTTWEDFGMLTALAVHEGRCEDCSNVENAFLRTLGVPGCQAYTPWWGHQDGNHAWTWIRGMGEAPGDGRNGVKVYVKTWDGNEDVTAEYTPVSSISVPADADGTLELRVWNSGDWRALCSERAEGGRAVFSDVGCRLNQVLSFAGEGQRELLCDLRSDGGYRWLRMDPLTSGSEDGFRVDYDKSTPLGEMDPGADYSLLVYTSTGWQEAPSERLSTGGFSFTGMPDRLYRITGPGIANRPFTVELADNGEVLTLKR
ncbi:hypothetical protein KDL44_10845 [bacterium]|nr:hypothetical protein [bacterium]